MTKATLDADVVLRALDAFEACEQTVGSCALRTLGAADAVERGAVISRHLDCADVVGLTRRVLMRGSGPDGRLLMTQVQACLAACERSLDSCSATCAGPHAHGCAELARRVAGVCNEVLAALQ